MALTSTRMGERRMVGGRERQFEREARKVGGQFGQSLREEAAMMRLDRGSNIGSADADIRDQRLRNTMAESMIAQGREARGVSAPSTPGPDRLAAMQSGGQESFAQTEARKRRESAASGAFGRGAQMKADENLQGRRALFAEMRGDGDGDITGRSEEFRERARSLGVDDEGWSSAVNRLNQLESDIADESGERTPLIPQPSPLIPRSGRVTRSRNR